MRLTSLCKIFIRSPVSGAFASTFWPFPPTTPAVITVTDLHKSYRDVIAVAGLSFSTEPGQILGLLGPNGAGKTTTMRAIAGIIPPTKGKLIVAGHDVVTDAVAAKRELSYVPDDPKLFDA